MLPAAYVQSGTVDLANLPLISGVANSVAPNIYFILDDSTSMSWDYMPDSVGNDDNENCFKNFGYNTIYYNPSITYAVPKNADGTDFSSANTSWTSAKNNGFSSVSSTTNLSSTTTNTTTTISDPVRLPNNPFTTTNRSRNVTVNQPGHGLASGDRVTITGAVRFNNVTLNGTYTISNVTANSYRIQAGNDANRSGTGGGNNVYETHRISTTTEVGDYGWYEYEANPTAPPSTCEGDSEYVWRWPTTDAEKLNYTNWYSYYRTRILMMKSATGRAFAGINEDFRVGYSAISEKGTGSTKFLKFDRFEGAHKTSWYDKLYKAGCSSGTCFTPLRGALSKAGRVYAGKVLTGNDDPVQYSCQKNYTILTTDGYWNTSDETRGGTAISNYAAYREDNLTEVGDQDGVTGTTRPFLDSGKYPNSLADIAMYYYKSDLRPTGSTGGLNEEGVRIDVSNNDGETAAPWQHMKTYTLGLGVNGTLAYSEDYLDGGSADYEAIKQGTKNWPNPKTSPLSTSATETTRIDDLWHAAVNGRGAYLSAGNPDSLVTALEKMLSAIQAEDASAAAAATSSLEPVAGDNRAYVAQYTTLSWHGDLLARDIDLTDGSLSTTSAWSAKSRLTTKVGASSDSREIYTYSAAASDKLKSFEAANLTTEIAAGYFKSSASNPGGALSHYGALTTAQKSSATDAAMIAFLRGRTGYEKEAANVDDNRVFRDRNYALGDIVNAAPVYVKKPPFRYADAGYSDFLADQASREGTVYVGANDGMLHAFDAETGDERWAYIPSFVVPNLYKLADSNYADNHRFFVDGPITVGDVYDAADDKWRTVLVGGLGRGGQGFYALDVTDPDDPEALWEFGVAQDADMGYSYGNAVLTKRASDGKWVVLVASGYNNSAGDKKGRLYVLDAISGAKLNEIVPSGSPTDEDQSGIAKINNWVLNTLVDNTTQYVYGGDLGGSLWRFDISNNSSQRLGRTSSTAGDQPITVKPEVARVKDSAGTYYRVVYFGTGRYLGFDDLASDAKSNTEAQAIYAVKDTGDDLGVLSDEDAALVEQTVDASGDDEGEPRTIPSPLPVNWLTNNGWYVETPLGERLNVDPKLQLGTLVILSNKPISSYCIPDGQSWLWALDYRTGAPVLTPNDKAVGFPVGNSISTGVTLVRLPTNKLVAIVTQADTTVRAMSVPVAPGAAAGVRRVGWREIL
jgi:type IV pilus assembly protein PilY1